MDEANAQIKSFRQICRVNTKPNVTFNSKWMVNLCTNWQLVVVYFMKSDTIFDIQIGVVASHLTFWIEMTLVELPTKIICSCGKRYLKNTLNLDCVERGRENRILHQLKCQSNLSWYEIVSTFLLRLHVYLCCGMRDGLRFHSFSFVHSFIGCNIYAELKSHHKYIMFCTKNHFIIITWWRTLEVLLTYVNVQCLLYIRQPHASGIPST